MEKINNFLSKLLERPEEKLSLVNKCVLVMGTLLSVCYGLKLMFVGRATIVYNTFPYGYSFEMKKSFLGGLLVMVCGAGLTYLAVLVTEAFLDLVRNTRKDSCDCADAVVVADADEAVIEEEVDDSAKNAMIKYYSLIPNVGQKAAEKLYEAFGTDLGAVAKDNPEALDEIKGLTAKAKKEIIKFFK